MAKVTSILVVLSLFRQSRQFQPKCPRRGLPSESGVELQGFVYKSFPNPKLSSCFFYCMDDNVCQSINYDTQTLQCQFNKEIKRLRPSNVRPKEHVIYMENPERGKSAFLLPFFFHLSILLTHLVSLHVLVKQKLLLMITSNISRTKKTNFGMFNK